MYSDPNCASGTVHGWVAFVNVPGNAGTPPVKSLSCTKNMQIGPDRREGGIVPVRALSAAEKTLSCVMREPHASGNDPDSRLV